MTTFHYFAPATINSAFDLLERYGSDARLLAGGTDLLVRIKSGRWTPKAVIDIKAIHELSSRVETVENVVEIGALTLMAEIEQNAMLRRYFPALVEAASSVGSVQIRNRATLAGNLCNASPAADTAPALLVYETKVKTTGKGGSRLIALDQFLLGPGKNALLPGEMVEAVHIPIPIERQIAVFDRLTRRKGVDLATINVCCQVFSSNLTRIAVGAAGPVPFVVTETTGKLSDPRGDKESKKQLLYELMQQARPISDVRASQGYRQAMISVLAERALEKAIDRLNT